MPASTNTVVPPVKVVLADAQSIFRASLRHLLSVPASVIQDVYGVNVAGGFRVVGEAGTGEDIVRVVQSAQPDLLLFDPYLPRMSGFEALGEIEAARGWQMRTILLASALNKVQLLQSVQLGVRGVVLKDSTTEVLFEAIASVMAGRYWLGQTLVSDLIESVRPLIDSSRSGSGKSAFGLTSREQDVVTMVVSGCSNKEIAQKCTVSEETIKHHMTHIFEKVGASNRLELAMIATRHGIRSSV
jgi:two-component system, NarL family, nitrate/nitrite response regulator NarL